MAKTDSIQKPEEREGYRLPNASHWYRHVARRGFGPKPDLSATPYLAFGAIAVCVLGWSSGWGIARAILFFGITIAIVMLGLLPCLSKARPGWASASDLLLLKGAVGPIWLVELSVFKNGHRTGSDRGVLGFDDGAMFFTGRKCSFQIGSQDLTWRAGENERSTSLDRQGRYARFILGLVHPQADFGIGLLVLERSEYDQEQGVESLAIALHAFGRGGPTSAPRSYPPLNRQTAKP